MLKLLILDIDGVLTDGTKVYDNEHNVIGKKYMCKDFTAIKRFIAAGIKVILISGDRQMNQAMAEQRNLDFYFSRQEDGSLDKSVFLDEFEKKYHVSREEMGFVGDDLFDIQIMEKVKYKFCPSDAPCIVKKYCVVLEKTGGSGVLVELYDLLEKSGVVKSASIEKVKEIDIKEESSWRM